MISVEEALPDQPEGSELPLIDRQIQKFVKETQLLKLQKHWNFLNQDFRPKAWKY